ncbi:hypothetical protein TeGR_g12132, partial [Tetraparma gracilis]
QLKGSALSCGLGSGVALGCSSSPPSTWPDRDHGLVCGDCKVLVNQFRAKYGGTCDGYCGSMGMQCAGAWEEVGDTCTVLYNMECNEVLDSSDAICECREPEQECEQSDAVQTIAMSASDGKPQYISLGEHDSELLITTKLGKVLRRCLEGTGCDPQTRNSVMMLYGGSNLRGIGVLDETYIVADMDKIYECPLTSVGISKYSCEVFAYQPQGTYWDPINVLVDPIKRLVHDPSSPAHASLTASIVIPYAGDWAVHVTQGTYNVQHFLGSPRLITVAAAATDPASCVVDFPNGRSITAGSSFDAVVTPFDEFENPTSHPEDSFKSRVELGNSEENFGNRHVLSSDHTFSKMQTVAGT